MIKVDKLSYSFPQKNLYNDISFTLEDGQHCAFIGTNGISVKGGYSTPDVEEAAVKSEVLKRGRNNFILGDHTKFDKEYAVTFGILKDACIVTDELEDNEFREYAVVKEAFA